MSSSIGFTMVVPTRNRPALLKRLLDYWERVCQNWTIVVADSSDPQHQKANQELCGEIRLHAVVYRAFPTDLSFIEKLVKAVDLVDTPFMCVCADDDFLLPHPVADAVDLLRKNTDVSCVQGLEIFFRPATTVGFNDRLLLDIHGGSSIVDPTAAARLKTHLGEYRPSIYSIRRSREFAEDVKSIVPLQSQFMLMELAFASLDAIRGKIKRLPDVMAMRESHAEVAFRKETSVTYWENVIFSPQFSQWLALYLGIVGSRLREFSGLSEDEACEAVRESLRAFSIRHFKSLDRQRGDSDAPLSRLKSAAFKVPVVGALAKALWLKAAKAYDRHRIQNRYGEALGSADYTELIRHLEAYFGFQPGKSIVR